MFGGGSNNKKEEEATPYGFTVDWSMEPNAPKEENKNNQSSFGGSSEPGFGSSANTNSNSLQ